MLVPGAREITSLKKQLNYMNFSKQEIDPISSKKRNKIYNEFNKTVYQYEDDRRSTMEKALEE